MCGAYSCSHRGPSKSHFQPIQLQNHLPNLDFVCCNIATYITLDIFANSHKGFALSHPLATHATNLSSSCLA
jgi:hypothetical protein